MKAADGRRKVQRQLKQFTLVGPFFAPKGQGNWFPTALDGVKDVPRKFRLGGHDIPIKRLRLMGNVLDLERELGALVSRSPCGMRNLGYVFCRFMTPAAGTLTVAYSGARMTWWVDGREVYATRSGNGAPAPSFYHRFQVGLEQGQHVLCIRVLSMAVDWKVYLPTLTWRAGLDDSVRTDRNVPWRDYRHSLVRIEERPVPTGSLYGVSKEIYEDNLACQGVDARWLGIVNSFGGPVFKSRHLPVGTDAKPEYEQQFKEWVQLLHKKRISVMSWYALHLNHPAWEKHPDWRQRYLVAKPGLLNVRNTCCINSPYGTALIRFVIEVLRKFELDGIWFDGAAFSPIWEAPQPISCICRHCRAKFKRDTGLELPARYDWNLPEFPRWVQWRYDMHSGYWQRLVDAVHKVVPQAAFVFNHYHRENIGWNAAVPLNPFGHGFVSGTETDSEPLRGAFYTRLMRAYGRPHTEVWMDICGGRYAEKDDKTVVYNSRKVLDFAVACATAGGNCSVGGVDLSVEGPAVGLMARELKPREPYLNLPAIPHMALHVSQQTETFVFGRNPEYIKDDWTDYAWNSLTGWHHLLAFAGRTCDVVFDAHVKKTTLASYPVLVMPMAVALTATQLADILDYVRAGGTLITGPWFGLRDEWGEETAGYPLGEGRLFPFGRVFPSWDKFEQRPELSFTFTGAPPVKTRALADWSRAQRRFTLEFSAQNPAYCRNKLGRGQLVQSAFDWGTLFRYTSAETVLKAFRAFYAALNVTPPLVELVNETGDLILGVFRKDSRTVCVHVQHFQAAWERQEAMDPLPPTRETVTLRWNGKAPKSVRLALPEPLQTIMPIKEGNSTLITIPAFVRGQIVLIES